jgi:hypothetical protein
MTEVDLREFISGLSRCCASHYLRTLAEKGMIESVRRDDTSEWMWRLTERGMRVAASRRSQVPRGTRHAQRARARAAAVPRELTSTERKTIQEKNVRENRERRAAALAAVGLADLDALADACGLPRVRG